MSTVAAKVDRERVEREYRVVFQDGPPPILRILMNAGSDDSEVAWRICEEAVRTGKSPVSPAPVGMDL